MNKEHVSVLLNDSIELLNINPSGIYVDMTLGRGGHSSLILEKLNENGSLISFDQDQEAIDKCKEIFKEEKRITLIKSNFKNFDEYLEKLNIDKVDGFLFDLGVSSPQFDEAERGFSYKQDSRLDMRMDQEQSLDAYYVINNYSLNELNRIIRNYGDEKYSYSIAKNIIKARELKPIETTFELVDIIKKSMPYKELEKKGHPAKQTFQAIRIEVNDELNVLRETLTKCLDYLKVNGRCAVITFHSLEDKIVKDIFKEKTTVEGNRLNFPTEKVINFKLINKKVITPTQKELEDNNRSHSAKLRVIERIK